MRARLPHAVCLGLLTFLLGADYKTRNFVVTASTPELARELAQAAESYRSSLAQEWLGRELPDWPTRCPIEARVGRHLEPNGLTRYVFHHGRAYDWRISVQGERTRVLKSVLPHEITHAVFATHFGRPLPRWADEGVSIAVEEDQARSEQQQMLIQYLNSGRTLSLKQLFAMHEYPADIVPLYSQGYSVVSFLVAHGGRQKFVKFIDDGMRTNDWNACTQRHYEFQTVGHLQRGWLDWVATSALPATQLAQTDPVAAAQKELIAQDESRP